MRENRRLSSLVRLPTALIAVVLSMVAFMIPSVASAGYPPGVFSLSLSASTVAPGAAVTATANGCDVGVDVQFDVNGTVFATVTCDETGVLSAGFSAPTTPGTYTVSATELGGAARSATAVLTVAAAASTTTTPGGALPATGSDVGRVATSAVAVIGIGLGAVLVSRRRRQPTA